jgi:hypothetical protein
MSFATFIADATAVRDFGEWLVEFYLTNPAGAQEILRFSRRGSASPGAAVTIGSDTIAANTPYVKRLLQAPAINQSLWQSGAIGGKSIPTWGPAILGNEDGGLDAYRPKTGYKWRNRQAKSFFLNHRDWSGTIGKTADAKIGTPKFALDKVEVPIVGREADFDQPISSRRYRGSSYMLELFGDKTASFGTPAAVNITGAMTISGWIWFEALPTSNRRIWGWHGGTAGPWSLYAFSDGTIRPAGFVSGSEQIKATSSVLGTFRWYQFAFVTSASGAVTYYLWDEDAQTLTTETLTAFTSATRDANAGGTYVLRNTAGETLKYWVDELQVWNTARTLVQIEGGRFSGFAAGSVPAALVSYLHLDDGIGATVVDSSATAANGTLSGAGTSTWLWAMEGGPELAGTPKPDLWGRSGRIEPVMVDPLGATGPSGPSYQVAGAGAVQEILSDEGGNAHTIAGDAASMRAFIVASPVAGTVLTYKARGLFKLGEKPTKPIAAVCKGYNGGALGYVETAANIARDMVTRRGPQIADPGGLDTAGFTAFATASAAQMGVYLKEPKNISDALDYVVASAAIGLWGYQRASTLFRVLAFAGAAVTADFNFNQTHIVKGSIEPLEWVPIYEVRVQYRPNGVVLTADQVAETVLGTAAWQGLGMAFMEEAATDSALRADYPGDASRSIIVETGIYNQADARALADAMLALLKGVKEPYKLRVRSVGLQISAGQTCTLTFPQRNANGTIINRIGMDGLTNYAILALGDRPQDGEVELEVWG